MAIGLMVFGMSIFGCGNDSADSGSGNSDTVDSFHASNTPLPNALLTLNEYGQFPISVIGNVVTKVIPGDNISITPSTGIGEVIISANGSGTGSGDMKKSIYDIDGNGKVDSSDSISWSKLTDIPVGISDGIDNDTTYTAGTGLSLTGTQFSLDQTYTQIRVSGYCSAGNAIRIINQDGSVSCESISAGGIGDITSVNAGTCLTGGSTSGDATLNINTSSLCTGLDADKLDGYHASNLSLSSHNHDSTYVNVPGDSMTGTLGIKLAGYGNALELGGHVDHCANASCPVLSRLSWKLVSLRRLTFVL